MFPHQFQAGHSPREQKTFIFSLKFQAMLSVAFELRIVVLCDQARFPHATAFQSITFDITPCRPLFTDMHLHGREPE